ncbi:hypothetical protein GN958_ATG18660 [Phytophthora infestans]|uniref:Uncharacterized protein n=1 Tax=Phytophthora infestans TaxID=4787 RepID=A0A8S9TTK4_PHYIN|nr:hypothetical protein GN958_ATG18660 [Phytophthora infestans]
MLRITGNYGEVSGLKVNQTKTLIIALHPSGLLSGVGTDNPIPVQTASSFHRYLGAQIGGTGITDYTWTKTVKQLAIRLRLAQLKTLAPAPRAMIAAAIIMPKLLFVARHTWPTTAWLFELQARILNFVWHDLFSDTGVSGRHWISQDIAALPRKEGGLAVPNVKAEVLALAATEVTRWALTSNCTMLIAGDILFSGTTGSGASETYVPLGFRTFGISGLPYPDSL